MLGKCIGTKQCSDGEQYCFFHFNDIIYPCFSPKEKELELGFFSFKIFNTALINNQTIINYSPILYFTSSVIPFQLSVLKGAAGNPSLLNKLLSPASSAQLNLTATGAVTPS